MSNMMVTPSFLTNTSENDAWQRRLSVAKPVALGYIIFSEISIAYRMTRNAQISDFGNKFHEEMRNYVFCLWPKENAYYQWKWLFIKTSQFDPLTHKIHSRFHTHTEDVSKIASSLINDHLLKKSWLKIIIPAWPLPSAVQGNYLFWYKCSATISDPTPPYNHWPHTLDDSIALYDVTVSSCSLFFE
jgi:hypothetical protein